MFKQIQIFISAVVLVIGSSLSLAAEHPAQKLVEDSVTALLEVYKNEGERLKSDPEFLQATVDELIIPNLNFEDVTKLTLGKFWRRASADQRTELVSEFKTLLLKAYTGALAEYSGEAISFEPFRAGSRDDRAVVRANFSQRTGREVPVSFDLREKNGWTINNVQVGDFSLVGSYKSAFSSEIEKGGIEGLIKALKERNGTS